MAGPRAGALSRTAISARVLASFPRPPSPPPSEGRLQHAITVQREQVEFQRLSTLLESLPAGHPARSSWLEVDEFAQTLITSWPSSATTGVDLGFDDCLCHSAATTSEV